MITNLRMELFEALVCSPQLNRYNTHNWWLEMKIGNVKKCKYLQLLYIWLPAHKPGNCWETVNCDTTRCLVPVVHLTFSYDCFCSGRDGICSWRLKIWKKPYDPLSTSILGHPTWWKANLALKNEKFWNFHFFHIFHIFGCHGQTERPWRLIFGIRDPLDGSSQWCE